MSKMQAQAAADGEVSNIETSIAPHDHAIVDQARQEGNDIISNSASNGGDHDPDNYGTEEIFVGHDPDEAMTTADIVLCMADKFRNRFVDLSKVVTISNNTGGLPGRLRLMQKWADFELDLETNSNQPVEEVLEKLYALEPALRPKEDTKPQEIQSINAGKARL